MSQDARPRILLLYNRNETTTASYLEAALRRTADVVTAGDRQQVHVARGTQLPIPRLLEHLGAPLDLVLEVEGDNVDAVGQEDVETPCAWWAIDSHLHMSYDHHFHRAGVFDHVFVAQKHHVYRYKEWAWIEASWLPLAADPDVFKPKDEPHVFDVGFVGNMLPGLHEGRRQLLKRIYNRFDRELGHYRRYTRTTLNHLFTANHLDVRRSFYFNLAGTLGWFVSGSLMRNRVLPKGQVSLYNRLVWLFRIVDRLTFRRLGLSVVTVGQASEAARIPAAA